MNFVPWRNAFLVRELINHFRIVSALVLCLLALLPIEGRTQEPPREAHKAEGVKRTLGRRTFEIRTWSGSAQFCQQFLDDFRRLNDVELIAPDLEADSYDDPAWQPFRRRCSNVASEFFDSYKCEPRNAEIIVSALSRD
jgi:hypothetical protein